MLQVGRIEGTVKPINNIAEGGGNLKWLKFSISRNAELKAEF
jgi:hypothetical protein